MHPIPVRRIRFGQVSLRSCRLRRPASLRRRIARRSPGRSRSRPRSPLRPDLPSAARNHSSHQSQIIADCGRSTRAYRTDDLLTSLTERRYTGCVPSLSESPAPRGPRRLRRPAMFQSPYRLYVPRQEETSVADASSPKWSFDGEYFENCNCAVACPCIFSAEPPFTSTPTEGACEVAFRLPHRFRVVRRYSARWAQRRIDRTDAGSDDQWQLAGCALHRRARGSAAARRHSGNFQLEQRVARWAALRR